MAKKTTKNSKDNFKGLTPVELKNKLATMQEEIRTIRFKMEGARSKNVKEMSLLKKNIARVLTEINKK